MKTMTKWNRIHSSRYYYGARTNDNDIFKLIVTVSKQRAWEKNAKDQTNQRDI